MRLHNKARKAHDLRAAFTSRFVHPSCRDEGHQFQVDLYDGLARHFEKQLMFKHAQQQKPPNRLSRLAAHRAHVQQMEQRELELKAHGDRLLAEWNKTRHTVRARAEKAARLADRQRLEDEARALDKSVANNKDAFVEELCKLGTRCEDGPCTCSQHDLGTLFVEFLYHNRKGLTEDNIEEVFVKNVDDLCLSIKQFSCWLFRDTFVEYSPMFQSVWGSWATLTPAEMTAVMRNNPTEGGDNWSWLDSAIALLNFAGHLCTPRDSERLTRRVKDVRSVCKCRAYTYNRHLTCDQRDASGKRHKVNLETVHFELLDSARWRMHRNLSKAQRDKIFNAVILGENRVDIAITAA